MLRGMALQPLTAGVVGGSGYGGAELLRLLAAHPLLSVRTVAAGSSAGREITEVFPHLAGTGYSGPLAPAEPEQLAGCDVVFLATPHEVSMALAPALADAGILVADLSAAFRLPPAVFEEWYGLTHTAPERAPAVYALPELFRADLHEVGSDGGILAVPGCYPTAAILALAPLAGLVDRTSITIAGMSGTSGAGKGLREDLHASHAFANVGAYGAPRHRHTPEIEQALARAADLPEPQPLSFTPHLVPMARGLVCTAVAQLDADVSGEVVADAYAVAYAKEPFVTVLGEGAWPATAHVSGGNGAHVAAAVDPRTGRVTASCAIDNLGKGAAGQAIQAVNAVLGIDETAGVPVGGTYP
jgi:N-acetyl-gamma-glutamyl-phosphate reductase